MAVFVARSMGAVAALALIAALSHERWSQPLGAVPPRQQSQSSTIGPVSRSVIGTWQAHGADDGAIDPPQRGIPFPPPRFDQDWILDLAVLWRWSGDAPEMREGSVGHAMNGAAHVHRIVVDDRELRVQFDLQAETVQIDEGSPMPLNGANVLLLDVGERDVSVVGTISVEPRFASDPDREPFAALMERSVDVEAFIRRTP